MSLFFTVDPRDNNVTGSACDTCCCETIRMRPGETNKLTLNYAPWSVPLGNGAKLTTTVDIDIMMDDSNCSTAQIDGFGPPNPSNVNTATAENTAVTIDLTTEMSPATNSFTWRKVPLAGPANGTLNQDAMTWTNAQWTYTPNDGFVGWDVIYYEVKDAQGRIAIREITVQVGAPNTPDPAPKRGLQVDRTKIMVNERRHTVDIPLFMSPMVAECETYRLSIKQSAQDCDFNVYTHFSCFDVRTGKC